MKTQGIVVLTMVAAVAGGSEAADPGRWQVNFAPQTVESPRTEVWQRVYRQAERTVWAERKVAGGTLAVMPFETADRTCGTVMESYLTSRHPSLTMERKEEGRIGFRHSKGAFRGEAVCAMAEGSGLIAVAEARAEAFDEHGVELKQEALDAVKSVGRRYVSWRDQEVGMFSMRAPEGWKVEGGVGRQSGTMWARLWSPDGVRVFLNDPELIPGLGREGRKNFGVTEYKEGHVWSTGGGLQLMMAPYLAGVEFAAKYVEMRLAAMVSLLLPRIVERQERRDLSSAAGNPGGQASYGEVWFEGNGGQVTGYTMAMTVQWPMGLWVGGVDGYTAPAERTGEALEVLLRTLQSMKVLSPMATR